MLGYDALPAVMTEGLDNERRFSFTEYSFDDLIAVSERLARDAVLASGGSVEVDANGVEVFLIPVQTPRPSAFAQSWEPGPTAESRYGEEEMSQIGAASSEFARDVAEFAPGWRATDCRESDLMGLYATLYGKAGVLLTQPQSRVIPCRLLTHTRLPQGSPVLQLTVGHYPQGDWTLVVRVNGATAAETVDRG